MRKITAMFWVAVVSVIMFSGMALAADKFGYVSIDRIGDSYLKAKEYMKIFEGKGNTFNAEIEKKRTEVKAFQDKINLLSDKEKEGKSAELEVKIKELQEFVRQKQADLRKEEFDKTMELSKDIKEAINKYASKEGFTFVFDAAALAYQPKGMDITDKIIEILNKDYKKP